MNTYKKTGGGDRRGGMGTAGRTTWDGYGGSAPSVFTPLLHYFFASRAFPLVFATWNRYPTHGSVNMYFGCAESLSIFFRS
jgi:hypothetical protein